MKIVIDFLRRIDDHIVGCGERVVAVFDHLTGDLLVHFEIDVSTIGRNLACFTCDIEVSGLLLLEWSMQGEIYYGGKI